MALTTNTSKGYPGQCEAHRAKASEPWLTVAPSRALERDMCTWSWVSLSSAKVKSQPQVETVLFLPTPVSLLLCPPSCCVVLQWPWHSGNAQARVRQVRYGASGRRDRCGSQSPPRTTSYRKPSRADTAPEYSRTQVPTTQLPTPATSAGETPHEHVLRCPTLKRLLHVVETTTCGREERERFETYRARCQPVRKAFHRETYKTVREGFHSRGQRGSSLLSQMHLMHTVIVHRSLLFHF